MPRSTTAGRSSLGPVAPPAQAGRGVDCVDIAVESAAADAPVPGGRASIDRVTTSMSAPPAVELRVVGPEASPTFCASMKVNRLKYVPPPSRPAFPSRHRRRQRVIRAGTAEGRGQHHDRECALERRHSHVPSPRSQASPDALLDTCGRRLVVSRRFRPGRTGHRPRRACRGVVPSGRDHECCTAVRRGSCGVRTNRHPSRSRKTNIGG